MKQVSLIPRTWVDPETKALHGSEVGLVQEVEGLSDLATLAVNFDLAPAVFRDNIRRKSNLESMHWLLYDFDDGTPSMCIHEILSGDNYRGWRLNHLIAGSRNHLRDKGDGRGPVERFHVFIPLKISITDAAFYSFVWVEFARLFLRGFTPDPACKDVSRYLARHSAVLFIEDGAMDLPLEMFRHLERVRQAVADQRIFRPQRPPDSQCRPDNDESSAVEAFRRSYAFNLLRHEMSSDGQRYGNSARIIGVMIKCGVTVDEGLALFDEHAVYGKSFTRASVERMFRQFGGQPSIKSCPR